MKTDLVGNSVEVSMSRDDAMSIALTVVLAATLRSLGGWRVALVAFGLSLAVAVAMHLAQQQDS